MSNQSLHDLPDAAAQLVREGLAGLPTSAQALERDLNAMSKVEIVTPRRTLADRIAELVGERLDETCIAHGDQLVLPCYSPAGTVSLAIEITLPFPYMARVTDAQAVCAARLLQKVTGDLSGFLQTYGVDFCGEDESLSVFDTDAHEFAAKILKLRDCCLALMAVAYVEHVAS